MLDSPRIGFVLWSVRGWGRKQCIAIWMATLMCGWHLLFASDSIIGRTRFLLYTHTCFIYTAFTYVILVIHGYGRMHWFCLRCICNIVILITDFHVWFWSCVIYNIFVLLVLLLLLLLLLFVVPLLVILLFYMMTCYMYNCSQFAEMLSM
jgi:hypothetical protein